MRWGWDDSEIVLTDQDAFFEFGIWSLEFGMKDRSLKSQISNLKPVFHIRLVLPDLLGPVTLFCSSVCSSKMSADYRLTILVAEVGMSSEI